MVTLAFFIGITSCAVIIREDNSKPKGWNKNSNNPHHDHSTNQGKGHKKNK